MTPQNNQPKMPTCPYCEAKPCMLAMSLGDFGGALVGIFICSACEKIVSVAALPARVPQDQPRKNLIEIPS